MWRLSHYSRRSIFTNTEERAKAKFLLREQKKQKFEETERYARKTLGSSQKSIQDNVFFSGMQPLKYPSRAPSIKQIAKAEESLVERKTTLDIS